MVLNKSKWDKRAKFQYLKKHGLLKPREELEKQPERRHWSSKNSEKSVLPHQRVVLEDSDEEAWDSDEDDAFINDFYPQLGETELTKEQKMKIKKLILEDIALGEFTEKEEAEFDEEEQEEVDGIYLGTESDAPPAVLTNLDEFLSKAPKSKTSRKLLQARISDNLLEEYGLDSYAQISKHRSGEVTSKKEINFDKLSAKQLAGFRVGETISPQQKHNVRYLTEEEKEENKQRESKSDQHKFYNQLRKKFDSEASTAKILEINNFNSKDMDQVANLNARLLKASTATPRTELEFLDDLSVLLGTNVSEEEHTQDNNQKTEEDHLDHLLLSLNISPNVGTSSTESPATVRGRAPDSQFLDDLLG